VHAVWCANAACRLMPCLPIMWQHFWLQLMSSVSEMSVEMT
jgi:hypothetical protein